MNKEQMLNIDPRQLRKFMKDPNFVATASPETLSVADYRMMTRSWPTETRIVYDAVQEGYTSMDQLPVATGLTDKQIQSSINFLVSKNYISPLQETKT